MTSIELVGGAPGSSYDDAWWAAVEALYETSFPGLAGGIAAAAEAGVRWRDVTTPFVVMDGGTPVSHVGVLRHPMQLGGRAVEVAGFHAVCTHPDHRRRGFARQALAAAAQWADGWTDVAKLATDDPDVYTSTGFRVVPTYEFEASPSTRGGRRPEARVLHTLKSDADAALFSSLLAKRAPVSRRFASLEPGWLVTIDCALQRRLEDGLLYLPEHDAIVVIDHAPDGARIAEVIAEKLPPAEVVVSLVRDPSLPVWWTFPPHELDPTARAVLKPVEYGSFMVRGNWPDLGPIGFSPLWEH